MVSTTTFLPYTSTLFFPPLFFCKIQRAFHWRRSNVRTWLCVCLFSGGRDFIVCLCASLSVLRFEEGREVYHSFVFADMTSFFLISEFVTVFLGFYCCCATGRFRFRIFLFLFWRSWICLLLMNDSVFFFSFWCGNRFDSSCCRIGRGKLVLPNTTFLLRTPRSISLNLRYLSVSFSFFLT